MARSLDGIYAAVVTPFDPDGAPSHEQLRSCLRYQEDRGCDGVLLAGTTGEGPSLTVEERAWLFRAAVDAGTGLLLLAGTGAASIEDAAIVTRAAFLAGTDAAVIIPPFFFVKADDEGLFTFYAEIMRRAVPSDGAVLLYHNPPACGIGLSLDLIKRLRDAYPEQIIGIKDSSNDWEHTRTLIEELPGFAVFSGDDTALSRNLRSGGSGSITLLNNVLPELSAAVKQATHQGRGIDQAQEKLTAVYHRLDGLPRIAAAKYVLMRAGIISSEATRPPLRPLTAVEQSIVYQRFADTHGLRVG